MFDSRERDLYLAIGCALVLILVLIVGIVPSCSSDEIRRIIYVPIPGIK